MQSGSIFSDLDLFADDQLRDPWNRYATLREMGPAVWMTGGDFVAVPRYDEARMVLGDPATFVSGRGVGLNDIANTQMQGTIIASDGAEHGKLRAVLSQHLSAPTLRGFGDRVQHLADALVDEIMDRGRFDAVHDLARRLPLTVVLDLIGLPNDRRDQILDWAENSFNLFGPIYSPRTVAALENILPVFEFAAEVTRPGVLRPGSIGNAIVEAVQKGELAAESAPGLMVAYLTGGLDTTIASIGQAVALFAAHPEEWNKVREQPSMISMAYNEILRFASPIHWFSRLAASDTSIGGVPIAAGTRVVALIASANRDPRKWRNADQFDVARAPGDHLGFGFGPHACAGQALARLEVRALLTALVRRVSRFEVFDAELSLNNTIYGYKRIDVAVH